MPCRHEGGTDPCESDNHRHCRIYQREYKTTHIIRYGRLHGTDHVRVGYMRETLAVADLVHRCGLAYLNPMPQTKDDAFVKTSIGWRSVQVKRVLVSRTGSISPAFNRNGASGNITSDIVCGVDIHGLRIRYVPGQRDVPPELASGIYGFRICGAFLSSTSNKVTNTELPLNAEK